MAAALTDSEVREVSAFLEPDSWRLMVQGEALALSVVFDSSEGCVYLFSSGDASRRPVSELPRGAREALLFPPIVPLRRTERGFRAMNRDEWLALVASEADPVPFRNPPPARADSETGSVADLAAADAYSSSEAESCADEEAPSEEEVVEEEDEGGCVDEA